MGAGQFDERDDYPADSIGQPDSMRNREQRLRDNQGGSELTDRPDDHPAGAPGETASAEADGPPPDREEEVDRENNQDGRPEQAWASGGERAGANRTEAGSDVRRRGQPIEQGDNSDADAASRIEERLRNVRIGPRGEIVPEEEQGQ